MTVWLGLIVGVCVLAGSGAWAWCGHTLPRYATAPRYLFVSLLHACLFAPVLEETVYRLVLCVPLSVSLGRWPAVIVSGLVFAGLHVAYGVPSPENLVGGFILAWTYLKSESILVPVLLHGFGNLFAVASQVATWYFFSGHA